MPTLYVTNWPSRKMHGPGRQLTIMAAPRSWEHGDGSVSVLVPDVTALRRLQTGDLTEDRYRSLYEAGLEQVDLRPGQLTLTSGAPVGDGDTLCCACSREKAAQGQCHRVWAAQALIRAGWEVVLDGTRQPPAERHG